jgi:hypothetical protein
MRQNWSTGVVLLAQLKDAFQLLERERRFDHTASVVPKVGTSSVAEEPWRLEKLDIARVTPDPVEGALGTNDVDHVVRHLRQIALQNLKCAIRIAEQRVNHGGVVLRQEIVRIDRKRALSRRPLFCMDASYRQGSSHLKNLSRDCYVQVIADANDLPHKKVEILTSCPVVANRGAQAMLAVDRCVGEDGDSFFLKL